MELIVQSYIISVTLLKTRILLEKFLRNTHALSLGFVPTMGALHKGHLSLVERSIKENDLTVVSIFVNRIQFNNLEDFKNYPSELTQDIRLLEAQSSDIVVFVPTNNEVYNMDDRQKSFDLNGLDQFMEGASRKNHFQGVALAVESLIKIVQPTKSYFGEKDFQQLQIIRYLSEKYNWNTEIIGCPTIRETDGLAMSSRNKLLHDSVRKETTLIFQLLEYAKENIKAEGLSAIRNYILQTLKNTQYLGLDYFEIVDSEKLRPLNEIEPDRNYRGCLAVYADGVRLIDNITINT